MLLMTYNNCFNICNLKKYEANSWILYEKLVDQIPFDQIMISNKMSIKLNNLFTYFLKTIICFQNSTYLIHLILGLL